MYERRLRQDPSSDLSGDDLRPQRSGFSPMLQGAAALSGAALQRRLVQRRLATSVRPNAAPMVQRAHDKLGVKVEDAARKTTGHALLEKVYTGYNHELKSAKHRAISDFQRSGKQDDETAQTEFTKGLMKCEMSLEELIHRLRAAGLTVAEGAEGWEVRHGEALVATLLEGAAAYELRTAATVDTAPIYAKHTLSGLSPQDYVKVHGHFLRRHAFRGITPPERAAYERGQTLVPMNAGNQNDHRGYNFDQRTGAPEQRGAEKEGDLAWLSSKASSRTVTRSVTQVPNDPAMLAFLQARKGVGRVFSATSTPRPITSNHGAEFTGYGRIKIDLAKVPANQILHTYREEFDANQLARQVGMGGANDTLRWEADRGNETVYRNREIVLNQIPAAAVVELHDDQKRKDYENAFNKGKAEALKLCRMTYDANYQHELHKVGLTETIPAPPEFVLEMIPDHYTAAQAELDLKAAQGRAAERGRLDAQPRVQEALQQQKQQRQQTELAAQYQQAYAQAYQGSWVKAYTDGAEEAYWDANPQATEGPVVTAPPAPTQLEAPDWDGQGDPLEAGKQAGKADGWRDGKAAGLRHNPAAPAAAAPAAPEHDDTDESEEETVKPAKGAQSGGKQKRGKRPGNRGGRTK